MVSGFILISTTCNHSAKVLSIEIHSKNIPDYLKHSKIIQ
jgi:hypothetical protein